MFQKDFNDSVDLFYKQDEEATYPPSMNRPDYGRVSIFVVYVVFLG
jgi:hypothetical protein